MKTSVIGMVDSLDAVAASDAEPDWPQLGRYRNANRMLDGMPLKLVLIGDSITEMWQAADPGLFGDGICNRGISSQTTPQMLLRFMADVVRLKPLAVHLMAGTNDIAGNTGPTTFTDYQNNIAAMTALARTYGIRVILGSVPPMQEVPWRREVGNTLARVEQINRWLRKFAARHELIYADYHAVLAAPNGALRAELTSDGVHLNGAAYALMRPLVMAAIGTALK